MGIRIRGYCSLLRLSPLAISTIFFFVWNVFIQIETVALCGSYVLLLRCAVPLPPLSLCRFRIHDNKDSGVIVVDASPRLERCELWGNGDAGVWENKGGPTLTACTLRDHAEGRAAGVYLRSGSHATVGADCVFARNAKGDVVRGVWWDF